MAHKLGQQEAKLSTPLLGAREGPNPVMLLRILVCLAHTFHIVAVPNTASEKQFCYIKCNKLFLKIQWLL